MKKRFLLPLILLMAAVLGLSACGSKDSAKLSKEELTLGVGGQETLTVVWEGTAPSDVEYRWESSDKAIVTVEAEGETATVTAVAVGEAVVTVYNGNSEIATCSVTVIKTAPLYVTVPEGKLVLRNGGTATVRAKNSIPMTGEYVWESSDETIAVIESQGELARVTAKKRGECTITVTNGEYSASFTLIVGTT